MSVKLYHDATTKELVLEDGQEKRYPAYSEIMRTYVGTDKLIVKAICAYKNNGVILAETVYTDIEDSGGTPYASMAALKTALDPYFDATA